jgi:hypothetical protein
MQAFAAEVFSGQSERAKAKKADASEYRSSAVGA